MNQDDDYELFITPPERIKRLGYKPQREILVNHLLPYADQLDEESSNFLEQVKTNLAKAVMLREMKPACGVWSSRLIKYLRIYGLKFSKEDHIAFIKLAFELILIPDLEPCKLHKFATLFIMLTKKNDLLTPQELTLPWRPFYELGKRLFDKSSTLIGMYHYTSTIEGSYITMVKCARPYFEISATKEILEEFLPLISPWSTDTPVIERLTAFLPLGLPPQYAAQGHELWFDRLMELWDTCYNSKCGVSDLMSIFAGLAKKNPGTVDWSPYAPKMFTRFLHSLHLPVSYKDMHYSKRHSLDTKHIAKWIIWCINPDGVILKQLRHFLAGVESYLQSANTGRWSFRIKDLLRKLAREFLTRVRREREKRFLESWDNNTPEAYKLRDDDITEFINILLGPNLQALYSRNGSADVFFALQHLATLRPDIVIPPLIEKLRTALTSLTEPHRVTAAMYGVATVARPLLRGAEAGYPEGPTHVVPLLLAVLPGLDPNDMLKTLVSLYFITVFGWMTHFIDCSSAYLYHNDLTEEELLVCESTAQMEDFVLILLDRIFVIIESSVMENARIDTKEPEGVSSKSDTVVEMAFSRAMTSILTQSSPKIFNEALRKFKSFALGTTFETNVSGVLVGVLLRVFARINPRPTLAAFLPELCDELNDLLATDETLKEENPPRELLYRLVLLTHLIEVRGNELLMYMPKIVSVLDRALKLHSFSALSRATDTLGCALHSLNSIKLIEWRSSSKDYLTAPEKWLPIREWGDGCLLKDADFKWYTPDVEEANCAQMLLDRYLKPELTRLRQWLTGERDMCRDRRLRSFQIINAMLSCSNYLPPPSEEPLSLMQSQVPPTRIQFTTGVKRSVTLDGANVRATLTDLLLDVQKRMLADKTDDTRSLELLINLWEKIVDVKCKQPMEVSIRSFSMLERSMDGRGGPLGNETRPGASARLRSLLADAVRLQTTARIDLVCEAGITPTTMKAFQALYELSVNRYTSVRILAQTRLYWMLGKYPYSYRPLVLQLTKLLTDGGEGDEWYAKHKGALFIMLGPRSSPLFAKQDWEVIRTLWPAVLRAPLTEKPVILNTEQALNDSMHRHFPTVNTRLEFTDSTIDAAKVLLKEELFNNADFQEMLSKAKANENDISEKRVQLYKDLIEDLVDIAESPNLPWRRLELVMQMLSACPSTQTQYPLRAVQLILRSMIHDNIVVRRIAMRLALIVLKQRKRKLKKIPMDPYEIAGVERPDNPKPGYRKDLEWAMYSDPSLPQTDEEWDKPFLRNDKHGFYAWPKTIQVAAPSSEQVFSSDISPEDMEEGERYIYEFFTQDSNVDRLVAFLTVEEKNGRDKFSGARFSLFQRLFSQFGESVADRFLVHARRCAGDSQEASQRFAAEIIAASLHAPQYWSRERALAFYNKSIDLLKIGLASVLPETLEDWGTCVASGTAMLDSRRGNLVYDALMDVCAPPAHHDDGSDAHYDSSFAVCARLHAIQGSVTSQPWRRVVMAGTLLQRLQAARFTQHPYQNVRDAVGSLLMTLFDSEVQLGDMDSSELTRTSAPRLAEFLASVRVLLAPLYDKNGDIVIKTATSMTSVPCDGRLTAAPGSPVPQLNASLAPTVPVSALQLHLETGNIREAENDEESGPTPDSGTSRGLMEKELATKLDTALRLMGDPAPHDSNDNSSAVNLLTTVLRACMGIMVRGVCGDVRTQYALANVACAVAARGSPGPNDELARSADGFLASLALANHSPAAFDTALEVLEQLSDGRSWWARLAAVDFAQPLLFYGLPLLCDQPQRAERAEAFALKLMKDPRLEVRTAAAKLLTGLMHCRALADESRTLRQLFESCSRPTLLERHRGVLGLCAYLASRPYTLPPALRQVLSELLKHTNASDPIPATIRKALADFRRTHHDDWAKHREELTEEELDLLADLTSPPSYCA